MRNALIFVLASLCLGYVKESMHDAERLAELKEWRQNFKGKEYQAREMEGATWLGVIIYKNNSK